MHFTVVKPPIRDIAITQSTCDRTDSRPWFVIEDYLPHYNDAPRCFIWTKDADMILDEITKYPNALNA